jgi:hypothetical protein
MSQAPVTVTVDNFIRAESDLYMRGLVAQGELGKMLSRREPASIEHQTVIRLNRDTLYSSAVFDLGAGPVTITLPDPGDRYLALQVISEDHFVPHVYYGAGTHVLTADNVGTRYVVIAIRILVNPNDADDLKKVHELQDGILVDQASTGTLDLPDWDKESQTKVRNALLVLASTLPDFSHAFGTKEEVDPVHRLLGAAAAWGGNPDRDAMYLNITPDKNDGKTVYRLHVEEVPVDGFWSVSVYNAEGYFEPNSRNVYGLSNLTAKKNTDGSIDVQFGGCDEKSSNCVPIVPGWNYMVRLYRPRNEILLGRWHFPDAKPVG